MKKPFFTEYVRLWVMTKLRRPMVWTFDFDYDVRLRRLYKRPDRTLISRAIIGWVLLKSDGSCTPFPHTTDGCYVKRWVPANQYALRIVE